MLATELIGKLQKTILEHGDLPVFDWDDDEIIVVQVKGAETVAYGDCPLAETAYPDRIVLQQS
jgi:hypothetical protein